MVDLSVVLVNGDDSPHCPDHLFGGLPVDGKCPFCGGEDFTQHNHVGESMGQEMECSWVECLSCHWVSDAE